jgi:hypothetical protein
MSVGKIHCPELDGPGPARVVPWAPDFDGSSMGVIDGGGVKSGWVNGWASGQSCYTVCWGHAATP